MSLVSSSLLRNVSHINLCYLDCAHLREITLDLYRMFKNVPPLNEGYDYTKG
jgi:hypothetical protein